MRRLVAILSILLWTAPAFGAEVLRELAWDQLRAGGQLAGGKVLPPEGGTRFHRLRVENREARPITVHTLTIVGPPITRSRYAITGSVRHEGVQGTAYLEMWNVFPDGSQYFSRTLAPGGPLKALQGSAGWRPFVLPFFNQEGGPPPTRLILNVVLPGPGVVDLGSLRLVQYGPGEDPLAMTGQWWSEETAGFMGALSGTVLGCLGAIIGWLAGKGKARGFVLGLMKSLIGLGLASLLAAGVALIRGQPYAVYYPLLLMGLLCSLALGALLQPVRRRYEALELRKMAAVHLQ